MKSSYSFIKFSLFIIALSQVGFAEDDSKKSSEMADIEATKTLAAKTLKDCSKKITIDDQYHCFMHPLVNRVQPAYYQQSKIIRENCLRLDPGFTWGDSNRAPGHYYGLDNDYVIPPKDEPLACLKASTEHLAAFADHPLSSTWNASILGLLMRGCTALSDTWRRKDCLDLIGEGGDIKVKRLIAYQFPKELQDSFRKIKRECSEQTFLHQVNHCLESRMNNLRESLLVNAKNIKIYDAEIIENIKKAKALTLEVLQRESHAQQKTDKLSDDRIEAERVPVAKPTEQPVLPVIPEPALAPVKPAGQETR